MAKSSPTTTQKRGLQSSSTPRRSAASKNNASSRGGGGSGSRTPSPRRSTKRSPKTMPSGGSNNYKTPQQQQRGNKSLPTSTTSTTTAANNSTAFQTPKLSPKSSNSQPIGTMHPLYKINTRNDTREYYKSIELSPRFDLFVDNTCAAAGGVRSNNDGEKSNKMWTVRVGDLACVQLASPTNNTTTTNSTTTTNNNNNNNNNKPFNNINYQPIQILSIYRNRITSKLSSSGKKLKLDKNVLVEIRCFYRVSDLTCDDERCYRSYVAGKGNANDDDVEEDEIMEEEVFESDRVEVVDASFLLGRLVLHSDYYEDEEDCGDVTTTATAAAATSAATAVTSRKNVGGNNGHDDVVPTVSMKYNHHMYLHQAKDILHFHPTNCYTTTPNTTTAAATTTKMTLLDELMIRGIKSSIVMADNEQVKIETIKYLKLMNNTNSLLEGSGIGISGSVEEGGEDDNTNKKEGGIVTLPPPTLTIRRHKDDITMSPSSPLYSPNKQSPSNKKRKGSPNKKSKNDNDDDSTIITTKYYTSAQIEFPASPTTHPYETLPISWTVCVGDVVAVNCVSALSPMGVDNIDRGGGGDRDGDGSYNEWYPYETNWAHAQITAIYRHVDNNDDDKEEDNTTTTSSSSTTTTLSANQVQYDLRWFPRISEGLSECQDIKPQISQRLHDIANDTSRTCEEILEGNHQEIGYTFLTLLGPILIEDGNNNSGRSSGCGRNDGATVSQFVTQNRRTVNSTIFCDKLNRLKPSPQKKRGGGSPSPQKGHNCSVNDGLVERGIEASRLWLSRHSQRKVYRDAVMQRRKKRDEGVTTLDDADDDDMSVSALLPSEKSTPGRRNQSRQLFKESHAGVASTASSTKKRRSKRGKATPAVATSGTTEETGPERNAKRRKQSTTLPDDTQDDDTVILRVKCTKQPFHVDVSSQKSFYDEIDIQPPLDSYDDRFSTAFNNDNKKQQLWKVRLGDMVCIEVEQHSQKADLVNFPFVVAWCPAEIVSIYKVHSSKAECLELRQKISSGNDEHMKADDDVISNEFDVMVEVRWFYRKFEIPGAKLTTKSKSNDGDDLEEIFETDQVDACPAECLLAPLKLHEVSRPEESSLPSVVSGMPCIHYHCRRYWSIHRKSFVPSGVLSNRIERGRMHSEYKTALSKLQSTSVANGKRSSEGYSWKEAFQSAIQKLSLAEAAADVQVHGMELKCRERERQHIGSFLRKAIRGLEQPLNGSQTQDDDSVFGDDEGLMNTKSSIFICGPPGTGKTASVRSIINELQDEQASGNLPEFNFIALNGMEMRSPFDSYVKFWEALSGTRKERLSAGAAAAKLEEYFGDGERYESREDRSKKPITVLMLDEIDYLVTKKQTILYNFFDWPLRATNARLIVIGISNTINLPERLSLKLQSRLGGERCHFKSYTVDETIAILKTRLDGDASQVFDEDAIKFASRKTGNLSGDIRKAFQMCKVAAQNALDDYTSGRRRIVEGSHPKVKISDVQRGSRDMYTSIIHKAISCSSSYEALVLIAIGALKKAKVGSDIVSLDVREMLTKIESIANGSGEERYMSARLSLSDLLGILSRLGDAGILTLTTPKNSNHPWPLIQTTLEPYEINSSYRNSIHSKLAEKHLAEQRLF